jgi:hypothetical protein
MTTTLRDILYEFSLSAEVPTPELLDEFCTRYPEHAADIARFAFDLAIEYMQDPPVEPPDEPPIGRDTPSPAVERAIAAFHQALQASPKGG